MGGFTLHFPECVDHFLAQGSAGALTPFLPLVPQIGMMYLFLSFRKIRVMARAAFVMDRLIAQRLGLPSKSFVPLIVGYRPAATRAVRSLGAVPDAPA